MPNNDTTYVIFGASGDLANRYLLPALKNMNFEGKVVPISRTDYPNLKNLIPAVGDLPDGKAGKIFHLAIPPQGVLEAVKLIHENLGKDNLKILLEKPFGEDLKSASELVRILDSYFSENQIYRVDHYLAKESLARVINESWDRKNVAQIEIIASEQIDIEGRVNFYEQTGALKDFVQSHLLEMAAVVLAGKNEPDARHQALKNLAVLCDVESPDCVKRGQYAGYREEVNNPGSMTETFVSLNLASSDNAWQGVPIHLTTGKAMKEKRTEIKIKFKDNSQKIFQIEHEPDTYERVIQSALAKNRDLFISSAEVLESWRILDSVQKFWQNAPNNLIIYPKGSDIACL